jgi:hypothetical protein
MRSTLVKPSIICRRAFDPLWQARPPSASAVEQAKPAGWTWRELHPRAYLGTLKEFYRDPLSWLALLVSTVMLAYVGGLAMFWTHAGLLGELGPAISPTVHWLLDSTLGFVGLSPAVAVIMPATLRFACAPRRRGLDAEERLRPVAFAMVAGGLFTLATVPGPIVHDLLVGRGTWLANRITELVGGDVTATTPVASAEVSQVVSIGTQILIGLPTYVALVWLSLMAVRGLVRSRRLRAADATGPQRALETVSLDR